MKPFFNSPLIKGVQGVVAVLFVAVFSLMVLLVPPAHAAGDGIQMKAEWTISKWQDPTGEIARALKAGASLDSLPKPYEVAPAHGNLGLNEGLQNLISLIAITGGTQWAEANAYCGVGDSSTAASASQTGLQAATNKAYEAMDTNYPARTNQTVEFRCTYETGDGNFAWEEYTVSTSNSDSGINLDRKVEAKGTKVSGETWTLSLQITFS